MELAERNSTKTMLGSECDLKMHSQIWSILLSAYKSGTPKHLFSTTSKFNCNFNDLYLRNETRHT